LIISSVRLKVPIYPKMVAIVMTIGFFVTAILRIRVNSYGGRRGDRKNSFHTVH